jgi:hypothetical protein
MLGLKNDERASIRLHASALLATAVKMALDDRCIDAIPQAIVSDHLKRGRTAHHQNGAQTSFARVRREQQNCLAIDGLADMATMAQGYGRKRSGRLRQPYIRSARRENVRLVPKILS